MVQFFRSDQSPDPQCPAHGPPAPGWPGWRLALPKVCRSGRACAAAACQASVSPGVYAFGFLFMLPQLFVNYKVWCCPVRVVWGLLGCLACQQDVCACPQMKSVAHLPWKAFTYKVSALRWGPRWAHPQGCGAGALSLAQRSPGAGVKTPRPCSCSHRQLLGLKAELLFSRPPGHGALRVGLACRASPTRRGWDGVACRLGSLGPAE